jgi:hypothetical protein
MYKTNFFASWFVWMWNLTFHSMGRAQTKGVWEQGAEENIWTKEGDDNRKMKKTA